jgi:Leucine-rich repeat (LRR) protein
MLKVLDLRNNQFNDRFPSWLKNLPNLKVLILQSNKFNGLIKTIISSDIRVAANDIKNIKE